MLVASVEWPTTRRVGHVVVVGAPRLRTPAQIVDDPAPARSRLSVIGHTTVRGQRATIVRVGASNGSMFGGHTALIWDHAGHTYALGYHGVDANALALDKATAKRLVWVKP
jgi:hypothetical protein